MVYNPSLAHLSYELTPQQDGLLFSDHTPSPGLVSSANTVAAQSLTRTSRLNLRRHMHLSEGGLRRILLSFKTSICSPASSISLSTRRLRSLVTGAFHRYLIKYVRLTDVDSLVSSTVFPLRVPNIIPGKQGKISLPSIPEHEPHEEVFMTVTFRQRTSTAWADAGYEVAWMQFRLGGKLAAHATTIPANI